MGLDFVAMSQVKKKKHATRALNQWTRVGVTHDTESIFRCTWQRCLLRIRLWYLATNASCYNLFLRSDIFRFRFAILSFEIHISQTVGCTYFKKKLTKNVDSSALFC